MNENRNTPKLRFPEYTDEWNTHILKDLIDLGNGKDYKDLSEGNIPVYGTGGYMCSVDKALSYDKDAVGIGRKGTIDKPFILKAPFWTVDTLFYAIPKNDKELNFIFDLFQRINWRKKDESSGVPSLSQKSIYSTSVKCPIQEEEKARIGSFFSKIDSVIALQQQYVDQLKEFKKGCLQKMFPKKGEKVPEMRFPGAYNDKGKWVAFTDDWEQRKFSELFVERRDKTTKENEDTLLSCAITGIYLNSDLFSHFRGSSTVGYLKVKKNDLILSAQNLHLGNANVNLQFEHGIISPAYKVFELIDCDSNFVQAWVKRDETKDFFLAATTEGASQCRKNIEWSTLYNQNIFIPKLQEQVAVGHFFNDLDNLITLHRRKLDEMKEFKKGCLQKMFV